MDPDLEALFTFPTPMAAIEATVARKLVFDDEPLESLLYGNPNSGPSPASVFEPAYPIIADIQLAIAQDRDETALGLIAEFYDNHMQVPDSISLFWVQFLKKFIPPCPFPIVVDKGIIYEAILRPIFEAGHRHRDERLEDEAGTLLYCWYESRGHYQAAREVLGVLLDRARKAGKLFNEAKLTNDYGYEYLREREWDQAEPYFVRSTQLFEHLGNGVEIANGRANLLTCRLGRSDVRHAEPFEAELKEISGILQHHGDWRQRKPLVLLARIEEQRGHLKAARRLVRQAIRAAESIQTQHRLEDQRYLAALKATGQK